MLDAINNKGNGTAFWTASRDFDSSAITDALVRIVGDTNISFGMGSVLFTVSAAVFDVNSIKVTTAYVYQTTVMPGMAAASWDDAVIIKGIQRSTEPFDDTLSLQSSVLWTGFNADDLLTVSSPYSVTMDAIPEPSSRVLLSACACGLLGNVWQRTKRERTLATHF